MPGSIEDVKVREDKFESHPELYAETNRDFDKLLTLSCFFTLFSTVAELSCLLTSSLGRLLVWMLLGLAYRISPFFNFILRIVADSSPATSTL